MRIALAQINTIPGDLGGNCKKILEFIQRATRQRVDLLLFPELSLSGYPPNDFYFTPDFPSKLAEKLDLIAAQAKGISVILGLPTFSKKSPEYYPRSYNSALLLEEGKVVATASKELLPSYDVFYEQRYFLSENSSAIWNVRGKRVGVTLCEDIWAQDIWKARNYLTSPVEGLLGQDLDLLINLSASPFSMGHPQQRSAVVSAVAKRLSCPVALCNLVGGNDGLIFDGQSVVVDAAGAPLAKAKAFSEDLCVVDLDHARPAEWQWEERETELFAALTLGLRDYFAKSGFAKACLGLSGGVDSALVACIAKEALGEKNVLGIGLPSRYSSPTSVQDGKALADTLQIEWREISIEPAFQTLLDVTAPHMSHEPPDITEENLQARIRGTLLMMFANKEGRLLLSTSNKSEAAMGYSTLYGDMCGALSVIGDLTKTEVYKLARWINRKREIIPQSTLEKAPSAELAPEQKDADSLPDYALLDTFLQGYIEEQKSPKELVEELSIDLDQVEALILRIHRNEYKRGQAPPSLRVSKRALTVGWKFPIVQGYAKKPLSDQC